MTDGFYRSLASALKRMTDGSGFFVAVGAGEAAWDSRPPREDRTITGLVSEVARRAVPRERIVFLDGGGRPAEEPTPRLELSVAFPADVAAGSLRESGLFGGGALDEPGSGTLLSYFTHERIDKTEGMTLSRTFRIDLTPSAVVPGTRMTRYLGNTVSTELHDLENTVPGCQIEEIRFDRRFYFGGVDEAVSAGYDRCAYCFGRELSTR